MSKKMAPFLCTSNTQSHVDYGIPLLASKSTDYRTCTGTYHRFIPNYPQHFDCRVKAKLKQELLVKDVALKDDIKSSHTKDYYCKSNQDPVSGEHPRAIGVKTVKCIRNVQEKVTKNPPVSTCPKVSEMRDSYKFGNYNPKIRDAVAPALHAICDITGLERPLQPMIRPEKEGFWKYLDIYMTEGKLKYVPYSKELMEKCKEDLVTFYSATGQYKKLKNELPEHLTGNKSIYDKAVFKSQIPIRFLSRAQKFCPNFGMQSEYQGKYVPQTYSDLHPYIHENGVQFDDSLAESGPWQNLSPAWMYCTENCHIGNGWPVRSAVDIGKAKEKILHVPSENRTKLIRNQTRIPNVLNL